MQVGEHLLRGAAHSSPLVGQTLHRFGNWSLREFLTTVTAQRLPALQGLDDLCSAVEAEATEHFGPSVAAKVASELRADPIVPTSNHFGIETVSESTQATVLFALRPGRQPDARYVLVLGFGSISMNNWSYPMGLRLYDPRHGRLDGLPQRLPVFPNRTKQRSVCCVEPFDEEVLQRARARVQREAASGRITSFCARAANETINESLAAPPTLELPSYAAQSPVVNAALWRRMFATQPPGGLVQLQAERVCVRLLRQDLFDPRSLVHRLFFLAEVRDRLLEALDGERGCWLQEALERRAAAPGTRSVRGAGTVFFWALSEAGRRIPLNLELDGGRPLLAGTDEDGRDWRLELTPEALLYELGRGRLLPSLFTCFVVLAFARGLTCVGGYYQAGYLPVMRSGVVRALNADRDHREAAELVAQVPTRLCLAGMQGLVRPLDDGAVVPAGPVELAGMGGIDDAQLEALLAMTVRDACLVALAELADVLAPGVRLPTDWGRRLGRENAARLRQGPRRSRPPQVPGRTVETTREKDARHACRET